MGWTFFNDTGETVGAICTREFTANNPGVVQFSIVDQSTRGSVWYAIARVDRPNETPVFYGLVWLTSRRGGQFGYKDMDETCGPYYWDMPARLLDQLDKLAPNPPGSALDWRARCRAKLASKRKQSRRVFAPGQLVQFGAVGRVFELISPAGPRRGWYVKLANANGQQYRASAKQMADCLVIDPAQFMRDHFQIVHIK